MTNIYAQIILAALVGVYVLTLIADLLNLRALSSEVPQRLADVYDRDVYARSQKYTRMNTRFAVLTSSFDLAVLLVFWWLGGFQKLDAWLRGLGLSEIWTGILFIAVLAAAKGVLTLPFSAYSTFVIEGRFGFNRTTPRVFVLDIVKGLALALVFGVPLVAAILLFFEKAGEAAWLYCWLASTVFVLALQLVVPAWILPLFNKFEPLPEGELREAISRYADSVGFALAGVFVMDGSKRSTRSNAFFTGIGKNRRIALFDTLIEKHTVPELVGVVAHEIGHYKKKHILRHTVISIAHSGVMFFLLSIFLSHEGLFKAFFMQQSSVYSGLVFFGLLYAPIELVLEILIHWQMRRDEFEADRFAASTTGDPQTLVAALKKLAKDNLSNLTPHPIQVFLNYSHPPILQRIEAIENGTAPGAVPAPQLSGSPL